jgi:hypothetical protein
MRLACKLRDSDESEHYSGGSEALALKRLKHAFKMSNVDERLSTKLLLIMPHVIHSAH